MVTDDGGRACEESHYWNRAVVQIPRVEYVVASDSYAQFVRYRAGAST